ncbi:DUF2742 domain-containing protein [Mycobacterium sp. Lab-001]|uniref:DUF2742 domain-containing protein n=1 Tax=Mycobacterium sp. Lab-001 TaxID=3410136 RepID=UPI003D16FC5D
MTQNESRPKAAPVSRCDSNLTASRAVSWWSVHEFVSAVLNQVDGWPMAGTPAWCSLAHDDPAKWAALLDAAQHHALRLELNQEGRADASKAVSSAVDWPKVSQEIRQRNDFREANAWTKRVTS